MDIAEYYDEIAQCNRCGFCQAACPVFRATGGESGVARGRLALLRALIEGRMDWDKELEGPLFNCLLCGACTANCFPAIPTPDLVGRARTEYLDRAGRKPLHRLLFDHLLPFPERLHLAARAVALGKNTGLSKVARALGLLRIFGRDFPKAEGMVERLPTKALRKRIRPGIHTGEGESLRVGYFVGCGVDIVQQDAGNATLQILKKIAKTVSVLNNSCCGLPASFYGDLPVAQRLAEKNLERLAAEKFDIIATDCSSCASFLKKYPTLFPEKDPRRQTAKALASRTKDLVELISLTEIPSIATKNVVSVTYHDPCHASRSQGLVKEPREILRRLPGIEYRELPEADWCCGGAGSYALSHYDISCAVLERKMDNVAKTKADILVTSCPACMIQLSYGVRRRGIEMKVRHISEMTIHS
ncbi:MAG: (Fe-S)-binding protein [Proteobacteria bacterium]|nr:(Fe-S)-binding protein [Pseudomonadota bacterium]